VRVPSEAASGKVQVTLSLDGWKDHHVEPATVELTLVAEAADTESVSPVE
jgi:hypothetical protein